ncbi:MAG TPA: tRNA-(ms[2]io[6]A)-hydroxylase [Gammaproteobacteria bacterium]
MPDVQAVHDFLSCRTPGVWLERSVADIPTLLLDHAALELKAAQQALTLMNRYAGEADLLDRMSRLAREELRHFERVVSVLKKRGIGYRRISASRYFGGLHDLVRESEPDRRIDTLIVGAIVEARSCERFHALLPYLEEPEPELARLYASLLESEARHFLDYLSLAESAAGGSIAARVAELLAREAELILSEDEELRFHSGVPA